MNKYVQVHVCTYLKLNYILDGILTNRQLKQTQLVENSSHKKKCLSSTHTSVYESFCKLFDANYAMCLFPVFV